MGFPKLKLDRVHCVGCRVVVVVVVLELNVQTGTENGPFAK